MFAGTIPCKIKQIRTAMSNRIAHHEPICFNATRAIDTKYAKEHYELIRTYIKYMGFDSDSVMRMVEKPDSILKVIDDMK